MPAPKRGLFWRPSDLGSDHFSVVWHEGDGRSLEVGRIFLATKTGLIEQPPWMWSVQWFQRRGRAEPHQGRADTFEAALAVFKRCWTSADLPTRWPPDAP